MEAQEVEWARPSKIHCYGPICEIWRYYLDLLMSACSEERQPWQLSLRKGEEEEAGEGDWLW